MSVNAIVMMNKEVEEVEERKINSEESMDNECGNRLRSSDHDEAGKRQARWRMIEVKWMRVRS